MAGAPALLSLRVQVPGAPPAWGKVPPLRQAVVDCVGVATGDEAYGLLVGMVASELLENAIKYGDWSTSAPAPPLTLSLGGDRDVIAVEVVSPVAPGSGHYDNLQRTLAWADAFPSPREAFVSRLEEVSRRPPAEPHSGVGLLRVRYEGQCRVDATLSRAGRLVRVRAGVRRP